MRAEFVRVLREHGPMSVQAIAKHLGVREKDLQTTIADLAIDGTVIALGEERRRTYCLQSQLSQRVSQSPSRHVPTGVYRPQREAPHRPGALDHLRFGSRRGDEVVPYRAPVGLGFGLMGA